jgi:predicted RNase H-like nuclease (RuvC/YqgF family)
MELCKNIVRYAVIAGLVGGVAVGVAGPDRVGAILSQTRGKVTQAIDSQIEDPVALRAQMKKLESEYPARISEVRSDLTELRQQVAQMNRELEVSRRVVDLASADLSQVQSLITKAEAAQVNGQGHVVKVVFGSEPIELKDAYGKANRIRQVHASYAARTSDIERDLGYLSQQEERLSTLLTKLETEHSEFQAQLWQMDRQVDSIARNERLISVMERRQRTIDEQSRYHASSLDQLSSQFADIRAKQDAKLESLAGGVATMNYEDRAKFELDGEKSFGGAKLPAPQIRPSIIEIRPDTQLQDETVKPLASNAQAAR